MERNRCRVYVERTEQAKLPSYASRHSAGLDVYLTDSVAVRPGEKLILPTGLKMALPEGTELQVRPRSGLSLKTNLRIVNSPGTIDADYRHEIGIIVENTYRTSDLIDQLLLQPELGAKLAAQYRQVSFAEHTGIDLGWDKMIYLDERDNPFGTIYLEAGERIAQLVLSPYIRVEFVERDNVSEIGTNRGGGFGSTGK